MNSDYIFRETGNLVRRFRSRDPFEIMEALGVRVKWYSDLGRTKGFTRCLMHLCFVGMNDSLGEADRRIVGAHELGHIVLHRDILKSGPLFDTAVYDMRSRTEYEANLFAADLLLSDADVDRLIHEEDASYDKVCRALGTRSELLSFKLFSMKRRGSSCRLPEECDSRFLAR